MERPATLLAKRKYDDSRHRQHSEGCWQGMMVLCHKGSETPDHTAGIELSPEPSGVCRVMG